MIPMLSDLPQGAQVKIRQALVLFGEALIEIAGRDKDEAAQADLFAGTVETVAKTTAEAQAGPEERSIVRISDAEIAAVRAVAGTMPAKLIARTLGINYERVRYLARKGGISLLYVPASGVVPARTTPVSQAAPEPVEAAPVRTHGAVDAAESMDQTMPGRAVPGPDETLLPSSGSEPIPVTVLNLASGVTVTTTTDGKGVDARSILLIDAEPSQAETDADLEREELIEIQESEAHPSTPPDAAMAPDAMAEDGAAAPMHDGQMPEAAPSVDDTQILPGRFDSVAREPDAAAPAATEEEAAAAPAVSSPERRKQMIAEAKQAVALRAEVTRPRLREPVKTAMQPTNNDWVRLRHKDGRWLRMDGLDWLDAKTGKRENAYLCQRKQLPAVRNKFPLARECVLIDEPKWSPKDITWARGNT